MAWPSSSLFDGSHAVSVDPDEFKRARLDRRGFTLRLENPNPQAGIPTGFFFADVQFELVPGAPGDVSTTGRVFRWQSDGWVMDHGVLPPCRLVTERGVVVFTESLLEKVEVVEDRPFVEGLGGGRRVKVRLTASVNEATCEGSVHADVVAISQSLADELRGHLSRVSSDPL